MLRYADLCIPNITMSILDPFFHGNIVYLCCAGYLFLMGVGSG